MNKVILCIIVVFAAILFFGCSNLLDPDKPGNLVPKTIDEGNEVHAGHGLEINGTLLHVETYGDPANPVIIFLHGGPGGDFRGNLRMIESYNNYSLTDEYYLVFWDQRGCGLSKRHNEEDLNNDIYIEDLNQLIEHFSPDQPAILLGHSWGSMYAANFMNTYPEKVAAAVLSEPAALTGAIYEDIKDEIMDFDLLSEWLNDWAWDEQIITPEGHARLDYLAKHPTLDGQPSYHEGHHGNDPQPFWRYGAVASRYIQEDGQNSDGEFNYDFTTNLDQYTHTVLFMASGNNETIGAEHQQMQMQFFPNAELAVVPDCGHDYWWSNTAEVVSAIHAYLDAHYQN